MGSLTTYMSAQRMGPASGRGNGGTETDVYPRVEAGISPPGVTKKGGAAVGRTHMDQAIQIEKCILGYMAWYRVFGRSQIKCSVDPRELPR